MLGLRVTKTTPAKVKQTLGRAVYGVPFLCDSYNFNYLFLIPTS